MIYFSGAKRLIKTGNRYMNKSKEILNTVALACSASVFYVTAIFLSEIISIKSTFLALAYIVATGLVYLFAMIGKDKKNVLIKWLISIPVSLLIWWFFIRSEYSLRALNWVIPEYGRRSAGGNFAGLFNLVILSSLCLCGIVGSLFVRPKNYERFRKIQLPVCMILMVMIIAAVFILERQFPSVEYI